MYFACIIYTKEKSFTKKTYPKASIYLQKNNALDRKYMCKIVPTFLLYLNI